MKEGYRKIWLWLALMMLATVIVGGSYYFGTERETEYESEGTLVESDAGNERVLARCDAKGAGMLTKYGIEEGEHGC